MICTDSRLVKNGDVFIAVPCSNVISHIQQALQLGASVVFTEEPLIYDTRIVVVKDAFMMASRLARVAYPFQPKIAVAITGTNGKSSVAHFLSQIWKHCGIKSANVGTLGLYIDGEKSGLPCVPNLTTPDAMSLHQILNYLYENSVNHLVFEASSIALDQKRLNSVTLRAAAFTNLASDHLDYHKTHEAYLNAKLRLFSDVLHQSQPAIISMDNDTLYQQVKAVHPHTISFGYNPQNMIRAYNIDANVDKITFDLDLDGTVFKTLDLNLLGEFQLSNVLVAISLAYSTGLDASKIADTIPYLTVLNGRMEQVAVYNDAYVFVDYAHTTEGFKNALQEFRKYTNRRLICVFGCGGNRDINKRGEMGRIASELADIVIVTDDNPRTEEPASIRHAILNKCSKGLEIADRKDAIKSAIERSRQGDIVVIIGKGHETTQTYGTIAHPFSDKSVIREIIEELS